MIFQLMLITEPPLMAKLNIHGEAAYERPANTCDKATLVAKQSAHGEATCKRTLRSNVLAVKRVAVSSPPGVANIEPKG